MVGGDALGDGEAEARALPRRLGGEERIEDARQDLVGDARALVLETTSTSPIARRRVRTVSVPRPSMASSALAESPRKTWRSWPSLATTSGMAGSRSTPSLLLREARLVAQELERLLHERVQVGRRPANARLAHELEQAARDLLAAIGLLLDQRR